MMTCLKPHICYKEQTATRRVISLGFGCESQFEEECWLFLDRDL